MAEQPKPSTITKADLSEKLYQNLLALHPDKNMRVSKHGCTRLLNQVLENITLALTNGDRVSVRDIGILEPLRQRERTARNVVAGTTVIVKERYTLRLSPSKEIKTKLTSELLD